MIIESGIDVNKIAKLNNLPIRHVRDLIELDEPDIWQIDLDDVSIIQFDDGVSEIAPNVDMVLSWYFWQIVTYYNEVPISSKMMVRGDTFTDNDFRGLLEKSILDTRDYVKDKERVWRIAYADIYNKLFNAIATRMNRFMSSTDSTHVQQILDDPDIKAANEAIDGRFSTVQAAHRILMEVLAEGRYPDSPVCQSYANSTVKGDQSKQSYSARGGITDIDSVMYRRHIRRGYAMGIITINDFAKESRAAAKALLYNKDPVAMAEYFSRKMQLVTSVIERIVDGDCGTNHYHEWHLSETDGKILNALAGCMEILDDGSLRPIQRGDKHQLGKIIKFRTSLCCKHVRNQEVCETCFGEASYSIPKDTNVGHVCCTANNKEFTQNIISTKHLDFIEHFFRAVLRGKEASWFSTSDKEEEAANVFYNKMRVGEPFVMALHKDYAPMLTRIMYVSDVRALPDIQAVTSIPILRFYQKDTLGVITNMVAECDMVIDSTYPSFTFEFLDYVKSVEWIELDDYYYIDVSKWRDTMPMFVYPRKHENMSTFARRFEHFMRGAISDSDDNEEEVKLTSREKTMLTSLQKYTDVDSALLDSYLFVSSKLSRAQISHLSVLLLATRAADPENDDWFPANKGEGSFQPHETVIRNRSKGPHGLYEKQFMIPKDLKSYTKRKRPPSIVDYAIYIPPSARG